MEEALYSDWQQMDLSGRGALNVMGYRILTLYWYVARFEDYIRTFGAYGFE